MNDHSPDGQVAARQAPYRNGIRDWSGISCTYERAAAHSPQTWITSLLSTRKLRLWARLKDQR